MRAIVLSHESLSLPNGNAVTGFSMLTPIQILGPEVENIAPESYVKRWFTSGNKTADDTGIRKREKTNSEEADYAPLHKLFKRSSYFV